MNRKPSLLLPLLCVAAACARMGDPVWLGAELPLPAETDAPRLVEAHLDDGRVRAELGPIRGHAVMPDGRGLVLHADGALAVEDGRQRRVIADGVVEVPRVLEDGRILAQVSRDIGQGDLVVLDDAGRVRATLATGGSNGQPVVLGSGRVLFNSDRGGVMAAWAVDLDGRNARQLTNLGEQPGRLTARFVPPHARVLSVAGDVVTYNAGDGRWELDAATGRARRLP